MVCAVVSVMAEKDSGRAIDVEAEIKDVDWVHSYNMLVGVK